MKNAVNAFFDALDVVLIRTRVYFKSLFGALVMLQGFIYLDVPVLDFLKRGKWPTVVGIVNALVGYFTMRSKKQSEDLTEVARIGGSEAMARVPTPITNPAIPSLKGPLGK